MLPGTLKNLQYRHTAGYIFGANGVENGGKGINWGFVSKSSTLDGHRFESMLRRANQC